MPQIGQTLFPAKLKTFWGNSLLSLYNERFSFPHHHHHAEAGTHHALCVGCDVFVCGFTNTMETFLQGITASRRGLLKHHCSRTTFESPSSSLTHSFIHSLNVWFKKTTPVTGDGPTGHRVTRNNSHVLGRGRTAEFKRNLVTIWFPRHVSEDTSAQDLEDFPPSLPISQLLFLVTIKANFKFHDHTLTCV